MKKHLVRTKKTDQHRILVPDDVRDLTDGDGLLVGTPGPAGATGATGATGAAGAAGATGPAGDGGWDYIAEHTATTTTNTFVTIYSWTLAEGEQTIIEAVVMGRDDVPVANVWDYLNAHKHARVFRRVGGAATLTSGAGNLYQVVSSSFNAAINVSGNDCLLQVSGDVGVAAHWKAWVRKLTQLS